MTRKNVSAGLLEVFSEKCPRCEGRGHLLTLEG
jgi:Ribonuclease G/E